MTFDLAQMIADREAGTPIIPVPLQYFSSKQDWINHASYVLTSHPHYNNTEHTGPKEGWRGHHFTALCFDQLGRRVLSGGDFMRAEIDNAYPVWWVWPDQISAPIAQHAIAKAEIIRLTARVAELEGVLKYYENTFCEGFCEDFPAGYTDERCEGDCSGCKARAALSTHTEEPKT